MSSRYAPGDGAVSGLGDDGPRVRPYVQSMDTKEFDKAVVAAVFDQAGLVGWRDASLVESVRMAGIGDLGRVRLRFPGKTAVLMRFGTLADQAALGALQPGGTPREALFDLLMARYDVLQQHRAGVLSLMSAIKRDPALAAFLWAATLRSMAWMLEAAEVPAHGLTGVLRVHGLAAVWAYGLRAWENDEGSDLPATMAAVDRALDRAMQAEAMLPGARRRAEEPAAETAADGTIYDAIPYAPAHSDASTPSGVAPDDPAANDIVMTDAPHPGTTPPPVLPGKAIAAEDDGPALI